MQLDRSMYNYHQRMRPPGYCGKLLKSMYGTKDAAHNWELRYSSFLQSVGFTPGISSPCIFYNDKFQCQCVVHGDDFTFVGSDAALDFVSEAMSKEFDIKLRGRLGPEDGDDKIIRILNRIVEWTPEGINYEADP